MFTVSVIDCLK